MAIWNRLRARHDPPPPLSPDTLARLAKMERHNAEADRKDREELARVAHEMREARERLDGKPPPVVPVYTDEEVVAALTRAGVPAALHAEFVAFQREHGGRGDAFGLNAVRWGILHRAPDWLEADRVWAEQDDERPGVWHVHCADVHLSDTMTIDQTGRLYWCWRVRHRHYDDYFAGKPPLNWSLADT